MTEPNDQPNACEHAQGIKMDEKLLTPSEVAEILQVSKKTLAQWRWRKTGPDWQKRGPGKKAGVLYPMSGVHSYMISNDLEETTESW